MLNKDQAMELKEGTTMWRVYQSIRNGNHSQSKVLVDTALRLGQVRSALHNLRYVGMLDLVQVDGRSRYYLPDQVKPINAQIGKAENMTPAQTLVKNSICITNAQIVAKLQKGGRPKKQAANPVMWRPKTPEARSKFLEMGGSKWLDRIMGGLTS